MTRRNQRNMLTSAVSALCGLSLVAAADGDGYAPPPWWPAAQPFDGDEGAVHFAEFETVCLATDGDLDAIEEIALRNGWTDGSAWSGDTRVGSHGWHYKRDGREYHVGVYHQPRFGSGGPQLKDLPSRSCAVQVASSKDGGAVRRAMAMLHSTGCNTMSFPEYQNVGWVKHGPGYRLSYSFSRMRNTDILSYDRVGTDATFATVDRHDVCH